MSIIFSKKSLLLSGLVLVGGCRCFNGGASTPAPVVTENMGLIAAPVPTVGSPLVSATPYGPVGPIIATPPNGAIITPNTSIAKGIETDNAVLPLPKIIPPGDSVTSNDKASEKAVPISTELKPATPMKGPELLPFPGSAISAPVPLAIGKPTSIAKNEEFTSAPSIAIPTLVKQPVDFSNVKSEETALKPGQKFGHASDYRWVAGVLDHHQKGGYWTIRYAEYSSDDRWGGKVRLMNAENLKDYQNGDFVVVDGELLAPNSAANRDPGVQYPPFKLNNVKLIERAK
jgi:hypothetical protein